MRIRIDRNGTVLYAAMSKPLPYTTLDEVALDWAQRANPFPELPESIEGESYEFLAPVIASTSLAAFLPPASTDGYNRPGELV